MISDNWNKKIKFIIYLKYTVSLNYLFIGRRGSTSVEALIYFGTREKREVQITFKFDQKKP